MDKIDGERSCGRDHSSDVNNNSNQKEEQPLVTGDLLYNKAPI